MIIAVVEKHFWKGLQLTGQYVEVADDHPDIDVIREAAINDDKCMIYNTKNDFMNAYLKQNGRDN